MSRQKHTLPPSAALTFVIATLGLAAMMTLTV